MYEEYPTESLLMKQVISNIKSGIKKKKKKNPPDQKIKKKKKT
jgi:hypothetical protein